MYLVGNPRPTNPEGEMAAVAAKRGWPVLRFTSRSGANPLSQLRTLAPRGDGRWRSTRAVWFSSTATSWSPSSFSCRGLPTVGRPSFSVAAALSDNRVPASVQNPRSHFSQRSDCSISSSCLSRSVNSIARRRNSRTTTARRCSSSARRSSRPMLCASVCMVVGPCGLAVKLSTPGSVRLVR